MGTENGLWLKKDGFLLFLVYYRKFNAVSINYSYTIIRMEELI